MLTRLPRSFLRRYVRQVAIVVILLVAQTIGNLYLPNLNADIINYGVEKGDIRNAQTIIVMKAGRIVEQGAGARIFLPSARSHGVVTVLARPDPQRVIDRAHPDLPVSDGAGPDGLGDGIHHGCRIPVLDDDVNAEPGQLECRALSGVGLRHLAVLLAETPDFCHGHAPRSRIDHVTRHII